MNKQIMKQLITYKPSHYSNALKKYQRHTFKKINPFIKIIGLTSPHSHKYPVYQMLKACVKLLMLNELEMVMAAICFNNTKWDINNQIIVNNRDEVGQLVCSSNIGSDCKQLTLYILLVGWVAKTMMNENCKWLMDQIKKISYNFKSIFQNWLSQYQNILSIHPSIFNRVYSTFTNPKQYQKQNYQLMVDAILQMSHQYTVKQLPGGQIGYRKEYQHKKSQEIQPHTNEILPYSANFLPFQVNFQRYDAVEPKIESLYIFEQKSVNNSLDGVGIFQSSVIGDILDNSNFIKNRITQSSYFQVNIGGSLDCSEFKYIQHGELQNIFGLFKSDSCGQKRQEDNISRYFP